MAGNVGPVSDWASLSLGGLIVGLLASAITFASAWLVTSRQLRDATRAERRKVYAAFLQEADAVYETQFVVRRVFDRYNAYQSQLEAAQESEDPNAAALRLKEEILAQKERADTLTDAADGHLAALRARFFEVELIAPEHLRAAAGVVKSAARTNANATARGEEKERLRADDELRQAIAGFVLFARLDTDSPDAWVLPRFAQWLARKKLRSSSNGRTTEVGAPRDLA